MLLMVFSDILALVAQVFQPPSIKVVPLNRKVAMLQHNATLTFVAWQSQVEHHTGVIEQNILSTPH